MSLSTLMTSRREYNITKSTEQIHPVPLVYHGQHNYRAVGEEFIELLPKTPSGPRKEELLVCSLLFLVYTWPFSDGRDFVLLA